MDGVRLLSHRPSVLYKIEHLATEPAAGDIAVEGLLLAGPGWDDRLKTVVKTLSGSERACLFAVRLADEQSLPVLAETLLDRLRLVQALVDCAHELGAEVVAEGVERVDEFRAMAELGVDLGQGFYFGQATERPMAVDTRLVRPSAY